MSKWFDGTSGISMTNSKDYTEVGSPGLQPGEFVHSVVTLSLAEGSEAERFEAT